MRVPPTEKRGRVQTSSVSVAVVDDVDVDVSVNKRDVKTTYSKSSGSGGQRRDKTETCVTLYHYPTQIRVMCQDTPGKHKNEAKAWSELERRIAEKKSKDSKANQHSTRHDQIGKGGRAKKRRTYRVTDGAVQDHQTGKSIRLKDWEKGKVEKLH